MTTVAFVVVIEVVFQRVRNREHVHPVLNVADRFADSVTTKLSQGRHARSHRVQNQRVALEGRHTDPTSALAHGEGVRAPVVCQLHAQFGVDLEGKVGHRDSVGQGCGLFHLLRNVMRIPEDEFMIVGDGDDGGAGSSDANRSANKKEFNYCT